MSIEFLKEYILADIADGCISKPPKAEHETLVNEISTYKLRQMDRIKLHETFYT